ncbi:MAG: hypothetical protein AB2L13_12465 [Spirochaetota bacterium]
MNAGLKTDYGTANLGVQLDNHGGFEGFNADFTGSQRGADKFGASQTVGFGYNKDTGYGITSRTSITYGSDWRNMDVSSATTSTYSFDKSGRFTGSTTDTKLSGSYNETRAGERKRKEEAAKVASLREQGLTDDEIRTELEREAAQRRNEMNMMEKAGDMIAGAWLSMNGTLGQWGRDVAGMVSEFGESLGNWFTGNGLTTNKEMAVNAAMKELGRQEAVSAALGAHEEFSKNYDVAVKGAMGEYDRMQVAYKAANNEMDRINAGYKQAYNYGWGAYVGECLKDSLSKGANGGYEASFHGTTFKLTDQVFNFAKMSVNQNSAGQIIDKLHPDSLVMFSNLVHEMDVSSITFSSLYRPNDPIHGEGRGIDITKITDSSGREAVYNGTNGDNSDYMGELRNWFGSQSNVTQVIDPWKIKLSPNAIAIDNEWQGYLKLYGEETLKSSKNELEMVKLHWQHRHHLHLTIKTR